MKKFLLGLLILAVLALCFFGVKYVLFRAPNPAAPSDSAESSAASAEAASAISSDAPPAEPEPSMTVEEYEAMMQQEIEELQNEESNSGEDGDEIPSLDVSEGGDIVIGDNEGAGSL